MNKIVETLRKYSEKYVSSALILTFDSIMSIIASLCALLVIYSILGKDYLDAAFVLSWVGISFLCAFVCFYFGHTYRIIVRHSSLREVLRFVVSVLIRFVAVVAVIMAIFCPQVTISLVLVLGILDAALFLTILVVARAVVVYVLEIVKSKKTADRK